MNRSSIRTLIRRCQFSVPNNFVHYVVTPNGRESFVYWNKMNFMKSKETVVRLYGKFYRFRNTDHGWIVDISCDSSNFDRWANSKYYESIPINVFTSFCKKYLIGNKKMTENFPSMLDHAQNQMFKDYIGVDHPEYVYKENV